MNATTDFEFIDSGNGDYMVVADGGSIIIEASRVKWNNDELHGEVTFILDDAPRVGPTSISFIKPTSRRDAVAGIDSDTVAAALNDLCREVIKCERDNTSPIVRLCDVERPSPDREYAIEMLPSVPRHHMSIWFGDGGVGKSLIALYAAGHLARAGAKVLYLDWELEEGEHRLRYEQIFGTAMPAEMYYWRCDKPMVQLGDAVRRAIRGKQIDYLVVDSIAYACGGGVESSDVATAYANCIRSLGVGSLHLAHMTKSGDAAKMKPFGSVFWHSSARSTWYLEAVGKPEIGADFDTTKLRLDHRKSNFGPLEKDSRFLRYSIGKNRGPFRLSGRHSSENKPAEGASMADRIVSEMVNGPVDRVKVQDSLKAQMGDKYNGNAFRKALGRLKEQKRVSEEGEALVLIRQ